MDHESYLSWEANGSLTMEERLHEAADELINKPVKSPLDDHKKAEIQKIIDSAEKHT